MGRDGAASSTGPSKRDLKQAGIDMDDLKKGELTDETCPTCGEGKLLERWGRSAGSWPASATRTASTPGTPGRAPRRSPSRRAMTATCAARWSTSRAASAGSSAARATPSARTSSPITLGIPCPLRVRRGADGAAARSGAASYFGCSNSRPASSWCGSARSPPPCPKCGAHLPDPARRPGQAMGRVLCARAATTGARPRARETGRRRAGRPRRRRRSSGTCAAERGPRSTPCAATGPT